jgi:hypothetical protein
VPVELGHLISSLQDNPRRLDSRELSIEDWVAVFTTLYETWRSCLGVVSRICAFHPLSDFLRNRENVPAVFENLHCLYVGRPINQGLPVMRLGGHKDSNDPAATDLAVFNDRYELYLDIEGSFVVIRKRFADSGIRGVWGDQFKLSEVRCILFDPQSLEAAGHLHQRRISDKPGNEPCVAEQATKALIEMATYYEQRTQRVRSCVDKTKGLAGMFQFGPRE